MTRKPGTRLGDRGDEEPPGALLNESNCHRIPVEFSLTCLNGGDDDKDRVQHPKSRQKKEPDQDKAKDRGDEVVDEHRDLEVERFFAVRIDLGRVATLGQPDNERSEQVPGEMEKNAEQRAGVTQNVPGADIRGGNGGGRRAANW